MSVFVAIARRNGLEIYMPTSVHDELSNFATTAALTQLRGHVVVRGPDLHGCQVPAAMVHAFIRDLRHRVNKGLEIAEKAIHREDHPENVRWVREQYRGALRTGIVDSVEDFEVVVLAREVGAALISDDRGMANMAAELGLEVFSGQAFVGIHDTLGDD